MNTIRDYKVSAPRIELLHPKLRKDTYEAIIEAEKGLPDNVSIRVTQTLRTFAEQDKLFNQRPKVTNAKGGQSFHNYGLAVDFVLIVDRKVEWSVSADRDKDGVADWIEVANAFKRRGFKWGGDFKSFKDNPHFEKTFGLSWQNCLARYKAGDVSVDNGYEYINID